MSSRKSQKSAHAEVEVEVDAEVEKNPSALARHNVPRDTNVPDWFLDFKLAYPERAGGQGWRKAMRSAAARLAEGHAPSELIAGAQRYAAYVDGTGKRGTEYVKQAATFLGPDKHFLEPWTLPLGKADIQQNANLTASLQWLEQSNETR